MILVIRGTYSIIEIQVAGQSTQIVHDAINTEVIAVGSKLANITSGGCLLVQRYLTHTVDSVVGSIFYLRHTVLGTLHHQTATEDTTEVGTLQRVQIATGIARYHTIFRPIGRIRLAIVSNNLNTTIIAFCAFKQYQQLIERNVSTWRVSGILLVYALL